jgi:sodium-dependent phosphate transporter
VENACEAAPEDAEKAGEQGEAEENGKALDPAQVKPAVSKGILNSVFNFDADLHSEALKEDRNTSTIHRDTEEFGVKEEKLFSFLQVVSAIFDSFAHGANDGANAIGPFAAVWMIYSDMKLSSKTDTITENMWIPVLGGIFISLGMATYGYNVIKSIGIKLTKITPSRGYSIEMGSSIVVIIFSNLGIPLSTTHCQVGATVGVGMCEIKDCSWKTIRRGVNWKLMAKVFAAWVLTLVFAALFSASIFTFITVAYFPRSMPLPCGPPEDLLVNVQNIHPAYSSPGGLTLLFERIDANGDGKLT